MTITTGSTTSSFQRERAQQTTGWCQMQTADAAHVGENDKACVCHTFAFSLLPKLLWNQNQPGFEPWSLSFRCENALERDNSLFLSESSQEKQEVSMVLRSLVASHYMTQTFVMVTTPTTTAVHPCRWVTWLSHCCEPLPTCSLTSQLNPLTENNPSFNFCSYTQTDPRCLEWSCTFT